jgi:hypothetical protein
MIASNPDERGADDPMNADPMLMLAYLRQADLVEEAERRRLRRDLRRTPRQGARRLRWPARIRFRAQVRSLRS